MDRLYRGLTEKGTWEEFEADSVDAARPGASGYTKVIDALTDEEITD